MRWRGPRNRACLHFDSISSEHGVDGGRDSGPDVAMPDDMAPSSVARGSTASVNASPLIGDAPVRGRPRGKSLQCPSVGPIVVSMPMISAVCLSSRPEVSAFAFPRNCRAGYGSRGRPRGSHGVQGRRAPGDCIKKISQLNYKTYIFQSDKHTSTRNQTGESRFHSSRQMRIYTQRGGTRARATNRPSAA